MIEIESPEKIELTAEQLSAVEMVKTSRISILTGGPGTGKTTTVKNILHWADDAGLSVAQCAPTGKAAKRMMEATGRMATTIHSLLEAQMDGGEFVFGRNKDNPLTKDLLIVDETSMVTNNLLADLLDAVDEETTRILFVGDQGQLPSVGAGAVLRDMLASGQVPHIELTMIHRNSGEIVKSCHMIHKGIVYQPQKELDLDAGLNLRHIETNSPDDILAVIQKIIPKMKERGFDPVWDVQVISPTNSRTTLSCDSINAVLQKQLNPLATGETQPEGTIFRTGDKVIQIKNAKLDTVDLTPTFVVNGDMGRVESCNDMDAKMVVRFFDPDREIAISKKKHDLLLAYCITCHRAQGSEAPVVIIPVHKSFHFMLNRNWIYTAISRAKTICFTVGQFAAIENAIGREEMSSRKTRLAEKIKDEVMLIREAI
jgi:exodeoxyribonuclease V alpha subunit